MSISNDDNDHVCEYCGFAGNELGWKECENCRSPRGKEFNEPPEHNELSSPYDYFGELQAKCDDLEKKVTELKAQNNHKDECYKRLEEELDIIRNNNNQVELEIKSLENERNILFNQHKLYSSKTLYSGLTFTIILFVFSTFIWFVYSELESQQICHYNIIALADKIADKWVTDLKSKSKQLKLSISDKDEQIGKLNKQIEDFNTLIKSKDTRIEQLDKSIIEKNKQVEEEKQKLKNLCNIANNKQISVCLSVN